MFLSKVRTSPVLFASIFLIFLLIVDRSTANKDSYLSYLNVNCYLFECCGQLKSDTNGLNKYLRENLYGQHVAIRPIVSSLRSHLKHARKALALSLHGSTGTGKNYVSKAIAEYLYTDGMLSPYVHLFSVTLHFPHQKHVETYKDQLRSWIIGNTTSCSRNLFIFDEVHEMPAGVLDVIKPFLEFHERIEGTDYRKNMFLFLGNTGGAEINSFTLGQWYKGIPRDDIKLKDLQSVIAKSAYNEHGGLWHSRLIEASLINAFVPFLPMERGHVKKCILDDLKWKGIPPKNRLIEDVLEEIKYKPDNLTLYAETGCKPVSDKVNLIVEDLYHDEL